MNSGKSSLCIGDRVSIRETYILGEIIEGPNKKGEYLVTVGNMKAWVLQDRLILLPPEKLKQASKSKKEKALPSTLREITLDLHGVTVQEAIIMLEKTLDQALLVDATALKIIHGLGTGKVKAAVHQYLRESRHIKQLVTDEGNPGVTKVFL